MHCTYIKAKMHTEELLKYPTYILYFVTQRGFFNPNLDGMVIIEQG
jgi:hypothetical protein